ncbi:MAG: methyl-accepting chemotaxis protein [Acidobacteriota bacterium]
MTIGNRLAVSLGTLSAVVLGLGGLSYFAFRNLSGRVGAVAQEAAAKAAAIDEARDAFAALERHAGEAQHAAVVQMAGKLAGENEVFRKKIKRRWVRKLASVAGEFTACAGCHKAADTKAFAAQFDQAEITLRERLARLRILGDSAGEREAAKQMEAAAGEWSDQYRQFLSAAGRGSFAGAHKASAEKLRSLAVAVAATARGWNEEQGRLAAISGAEASAEAHSQVRWTLALVAVGLALAAGMWWRSRGPLRSLTALASMLCHQSRDLAKASAAMVDTGDEVAAGAREQAAALHEINESGGRVSEAAHEGASQAGRSAKISGEASHNLIEANGKLADLMHAMQAVKSSSDNVARIVKVIDEIAFQTNILALNAAVEAARAGAAGMGFAVVADEVRNLARRSAQAAKETSQLIEESIHASRHGMDKLGTVTGAFESISHSLQTVTVVVSAVGQSSASQAEILTGITRRVSEVGRVTSHTADGAERGAAAGRDLRQRAQAMVTTIERVEVLVG